MASCVASAKATSSHGCTRIVVQNDLSSLAHLKWLKVAVDGLVVLDRVEPSGEHGPLATTRRIPVVVDKIAPGAHKVSALLGLEGYGEGWRMYKLEVRSWHSFRIEPAGAVTLRIVLYEKSVHEVTQRPAVRFLEKTE